MSYERDKLKEHIKQLTETFQQIKIAQDKIKKEQEEKHGNTEQGKATGTK